MIAIQTNECLYVINMGLAEFLESAANDALWESNPLIKAKMQATFYDNSAIHFLNSDLSKINFCARLVGGQFTTTFKPVQSIEELEFYMVDGVKYSCEDAYLLDVAKKKVAPSIASPELNTDTAKIANPELGDNPTKVVNPETVGAPGVANSEQKLEESQKKPSEESGGAEPSTEESELEEEADNVPPAASEGEEETENLEEEELGEKPIIVSEEEKKAAAALDNLIRNFPNISDLPEIYRQGIAQYVGNYKDQFRENAREYLLKSSYQEDIGHLDTGYFVPNALGKSQEMIDSLLIFPSTVRILSKKDLDNRFLTGSLVNSIFMRLCPIGHTGDKDNREIQAYIQEFKITREDLKDADEIILNQFGIRNMRGISPQEKREYYERALEIVYNNKYGSIAVSKNRVLVQNKDEYLSKYAKDYYFPDVSEWQQVGFLEYDAREKTDQFPTPILAQLQNLNITKKGKEVKIAAVYSLGATASDVMKSPFITLNFDLLPEEIRKYVVETAEGLSLMEHFWDYSTQKFITSEELMAAKKAAEQSSLGDPFADDTTVIETGKVESSEEPSQALTERVEQHTEEKKIIVNPELQSSLKPEDKTVNARPSVIALGPGSMRDVPPASMGKSPELQSSLKPEGETVNARPSVIALGPGSMRDIPPASMGKAPEHVEENTEEKEPKGIVNPETGSVQGGTPTVEQTEEKVLETASASGKIPEHLRDCQLEDGRYIGGDGVIYKDKEQWEIFKLFQSLQGLTPGEEEKGKAL